MYTIDIMKQAKEVSKSIVLNTTQKNDALNNMAQSLIQHIPEILEANEIDVKKAQDTLSKVKLDRLILTKERIESMAKGIKEVIELEDPVGKVLEEVNRKGLLIQKKSVPLGVIAIIYESRPNVTSDAASLAIKSGNVCILRTGKEAWNSAKAIVDALQEGLEKTALPKEMVQLIEDTTRQSAYELMNGVGYIDLLIPRGGKGLISSCVENAKVPCIETGTGICSVYVDDECDIEMALNIVENAKTSRPSVCNAEETLLVHENIASVFLPKLKEKIPQVQLRLDTQALSIIDGIPATNQDFDTEFLDYILAVKVVKNVEQAIEHIQNHSTHHSDCIVTNNTEHAQLFTALVDSAAVYVNASTRFTDGGEFGLGCEMGISTQKLHARGPMGLKELTTYKYIIHGNGNIR
ncbi:glutamate-5-semialdehyde dehydrogenase [Floccifex sp.]|uniref:glutamate-5-semialdehyde dehydrogenase n=1 Tax=Floccifex sp. TaxID=2815810 RepID=UPI003F01B23A